MKGGIPLALKATLHTCVFAVIQLCCVHVGFFPQCQSELCGLELIQYVHFSQLHVHVHALDLLSHSALATGPSSTCQAMESIRQSLSIDVFPLPCYFPLEHNCTALSCPLGFEGDELLIKLLRCDHPPAIEVGVTDSDGNLTYYHVFNHSEVVTLDTIQELNDTVLNVTLNELCSNKIGLQVNQAFSHHSVTLNINLVLIVI